MVMAAHLIGEEHELAGTAAESALSDIIRKAIRKDREARYQTAEEMREALEALVDLSDEAAEVSDEWVSAPDATGIEVKDTPITAHSSPSAAKAEDFCLDDAVPSGVGSFFGPVKRKEEPTEPDEQSGIIYHSDDVSAVRQPSAAPAAKPEDGASESAPTAALTPSLLARHMPVNESGTHASVTSARSAFQNRRNLALLALLLLVASVGFTIAAMGGAEQDEPVVLPAPSQEPADESDGEVAVVAPPDEETPPVQATRPTVTRTHIDAAITLASAEVRVALPQLHTVSFDGTSRMRVRLGERVLGETPFELVLPDDGRCARARVLATRLPDRVAVVVAERRQSDRRVAAQP